MRRNLIFYWRINLAVAAAAAVTTAVLTGALLVGDSVRGSLRNLTLERLGGIEQALLSQRFFRTELADTLAQNLTGYHRPAAAILVPGTARHSDSGRRASSAQVQGIDSRFLDYFDDARAAEIGQALSSADGPFAPAVINESLATELGAKIGDRVLVSLERPSNVPPEFLLGNREPVDTLRSLRLAVTGIVADRGAGRFSLQPHQALPLNLFVDLAVLQDGLEQPGRANAILIGGNSADTDSLLLDTRLAASVRADDLGLRLLAADGDLLVESREMVLSATLEEAALAAAQDLGLDTQPTFTYLANGIEANDREIPYSTVTALEPARGDSFERLLLGDGRPASRLQPGELLLNSWAARDLGVREGDTVRLRYFVVGAREELVEKSAEFRLRGVVRMEGLGADRSLTPEISGVQDSRNMADWDPPFPIDLGRVRKVDEEYWDEYEAAPKAFLSYKQGAELWRSRFGSLTAIRIPHAATQLEDFETALLARLSPSALGMTFQAVRRQGLEASSGATDFGILFVSFSFFLILSALVLVSLLFRLGIEQRARELGLLLAIGYRLKKVNQRFLKEGLAVAAVGSIFGVAGAVVYGWFLIVGLKTLWSGAIGSPFLELHILPLTLVIGFVCSIVTIGLSIRWTLRRLAQVPPPLLLAGATRDAQDRKAARWSNRLAWGSLSAALLMLATAPVELIPQVALFFGVGTLLLVSALSFFSRWLKQPHAPLSPLAHGLKFRVGARNSGRNPGRSLMAASLIASACFVIVAVGANRHEPGAELLQRDSGAGGFGLLARSDLPLYQDLNDSEGLFELGFSDAEIDDLETTRFYPMRFLPGQDVSCLNLYQPEKPRVLGVGPELVARGGFAFSSVASDAENPWTLLEGEIEPGVIPAFGDANSVMWILHLGLGDDVVLVDDSGQEVRLRLVGLFGRSIFQGEILVSESNFLKHFPGRSGFSYFLIDGPEPEHVSTLLEDRLAEFGFDAATTQSVLASYLAVENTYLSTFQTLGGLGLLLGTVGLGIVLVRNVLERRGELATMRAFGFRRRWLAAMVMMENAFLLVLGLVMGSAAALMAVAPHALANATQFPWLSLAATVLVILLTGLVAGLLAVRTVLRMPLLEELKTE